MVRVCSAAAILVIAGCSGKATQAPSSTASGAPASGEKVAAAVEPSEGAAGSGAAGGAAPAGDTSGAGPSAPVPGAQGPAASASVNVTLADVGLEASSLDRTSDPCVDFYQFACGGWIQNNPIPADRPRWGRGSDLDERNKTAIQALLEDAAKGVGAEPGSKKLGDFYAACMDEAAAERAGTTAIKAVLGRTQGVKDARTWLAAVAELHKLGIFVVWDNHVRADLKASATNVTYLDAAGLGLPDRDYYAKAEFKDKVDGYKVHVGKMLGLLGGRAQKPEAAAADVVAIETEIAKLTRTATELRDPAGSYNPTDAKALARQVKSVDWPAYWKALGAAPSKKIVVGTPRFFAALDQLRAAFKPAQWASYFTYHLVHSLPGVLPKAFGDEAFELRKLLTGIEKPRPRAKQCIELTATAVGELLGQQYVARYFPASSKQTAVKLVDDLAKAMADEIAGLDWMADATRQIAVAKVGKIARMVGFPDRWRTYDFAVKRDDLAGNAMRAATFETRRELARAGKPVDRGEWQMNAYQVDAYYEPTANSTALPAGFLQPPFFGPDRSVAANLGAIGMVIGHEITHGFDDYGAQFDADGNLRNWWQKDDLAKFAERGKCVAEQYSTFEALPRKYIQGQLTLGENIADIGGVKIAFRAYRALRKDAAKTYVADGFTEDQQFFIGVAQIWCARERPAETERRLTVDPHSPPKFRVYGALRNLPAFADAFRCAPGTPMRPSKTCTVW
ncbi:MAG TPA: M13 family metallopeptidase [Kofleriaceae bacterium]|nr:M13 family metallopeptidase [Kofleriaceae bacterium]